MAQSLYEIIEGAKEELRETWRDTEYPEDMILEITDSACVMPNYRYLEFAAENIDLALAEPECGPAYDGRPTPVNIICANLYEAISSELFQLLYELQEQDLDEAA